MSSFQTVVGSICHCFYNVSYVVNFLKRACSCCCWFLFICTLSISVMALQIGAFIRLLLEFFRTCTMILKLCVQRSLIQIQKQVIVDSAIESYLQTKKLPADAAASELIILDFFESVRNGFPTAANLYLIKRIVIGTFSTSY